MFTKITWIKNALSNLSLVTRFFLGLVSQNEVRQFEVAIPGCLGIAMNDSPGRLLLLGMFAQQLFIHPKSDRMVVSCFENGAFWTGFRLLYFRRHR